MVISDDAEAAPCSTFLAAMLSARLLSSETLEAPLSQDADQSSSRLVFHSASISRAAPPLKHKKSGRLLDTADDESSEELDDEVDEAV